jgi:hypothetical protein
MQRAKALSIFGTLPMLTVLASASALSASEQKNKDYKITEGSKKSLVVMQVPTYSFSYGFSFSRDGKTGFLSRVYLMKARPDSGYQYISRSLKPGTYVMTALYQQSGWQSCFAKNTPKFTIDAGKVYYFGRFGADAPLTEVQDDAVERGKTRLSAGSLTTLWDPDTKPTWTIAGESDLLSVRNFVKDAMPKTTAEVVPLTITYSSLEISSTEKAIQICG